ncbi:hypothetical protein V5O48_017649, partial [Marasmius crinis-equi]
TDPVDPGLIERFRNPPKSFHLQVFPDASHHNDDIIHWAILITTCHETYSELTRRAKEAFSRYAREGSPSPLPISITSCDCLEESSTHPDHHAYQAACLRTVKAFTSDYCCADLTKTSRALDDELDGILRNVLDSSLLQHCAFGPELFSICETFLSAVKRRPPSWLSTDGWEKRRMRLLEWLQ